MFELTNEEIEALVNSLNSPVVYRSASVQESILNSEFLLLELAGHISRVDWLTINGEIFGNIV